MSFYQNRHTVPGRFSLILSSFLQHDGLPFSDALPAAEIERVFAEEDALFGQDEDAIYTPAITLWAFLSQVLHKGEQRSCLAAVARVITLLVALGKKPCAENSGAYCRAQAKLSEVVLERLTLEMAVRCESQLPEQWLWHGRHVKLVDGTTVSMSDTPENQAVYPQQRSQLPGVGFPISRMVVLFSLATAMVCGMAMGPCKGKETGEMALLRQLLEQLCKGDILLADRYYCSFFMIALLRELGIDFVVRMHQLRKTDFRRGQRLGRGDHLVQWMRPQKPTWMDEETYERMPEFIEMREVRVQIEQPGSRDKSLTIVTTLADATQYTTDDLAELYHKRWLVELDLRALKCSMGMDVLRCKSPEMIRKEIWVCLLAYNLIRRMMLQAASQSDLLPRQLSFTAAMQKAAACWMTLPLPCDSKNTMIAIHLTGLLAHQVGDRPDRVEPRAVKRRPKPHKLLTKPRAQARAELFAGNST